MSEDTSPAEPHILPAVAKPANCPKCNGTSLGTKPGSYYCKSPTCDWKELKARL